jgi:hypothetical protein
MASQLPEADGEPEARAFAQLLAAASAATEAATIIIETARAPELFDREVAEWAPDAPCDPPLGEAMDKLADAVLLVARATGHDQGKRPDLDRLVDAADRWIRGEE